jgi:hypothetical protein
VNGTSDNQEQAREYLLGNLAEGERERFEDRLIGDEELFESLQHAEDDLLDAYARGELPPAEREHLERTLLRSPRVRQRLAVARRLVAEPEAPAGGAAPRPGFRLGRWSRFVPLAAAASILLVFGIVAFVMLREPNAGPVDVATAPPVETPLPPPQNPIEQPAPPEPGPPNPIDTNTKPPSNRTDSRPRQPARSIRLSPELTRSDSAGPEISRDGGTVELRLVLEESSARAYTASLLDKEDRVVMRRENVRRTRAGGDAIVRFRLEPGRLPRGEYVLRLVPVDGAPGDLPLEYLFTVRSR